MCRIKVVVLVGFGMYGEGIVVKGIVVGVLCVVRGVKRMFRLL